MPSYSLTPEPCSSGVDVFAGDPAGRESNIVLIGDLIESGRKRHLYLDMSGEQVVAIFGKRGTGKSYTLGVLIEGLATGQPEEGELSSLSTPRATLVFDIMDIFWSTTIPLSEEGPKEIRKQHKALARSRLSPSSRAVDVWVPAGFERPDVDPPGVRTLRMAAADLELDDWGSLFGIDIYGEPRGNLIADVVQSIKDDGYTTKAGGFENPNQDFDFSDIVRCLDEHAGLDGLYQTQTIRSVRQRASTFGRIELFRGARTRLTDLLTPFRASILMMGRLPDALKRVVAAVLLRQIMIERNRASFAQKRLDLTPDLQTSEKDRLVSLVHNSVPRTCVVMDEAHLLAGAERSVALDMFIKYAKEGRNHGLSLAVATQQPSALDSRLTSQVETLLAHQLTSPDDLHVAVKAMRSPLPDQILIDGQPADLSLLMRRLGQGQVVFSSGNAPRMNRCCVAQVRPRITAHGGYEA